MKKSVKVLGGLAAAGLLLAGCGASGVTPAAPSVEARSDAATPAAVTTDGDPGVAAAQELVAQVTAAREEFTPPGPGLGDLSGLTGKTVYFVPANYSIPLFRIIGDSLATALETAGVDVQVCDGQASPASMAGCLAEAVDAGADAVVSGSVPEELASVAFQAVRDADIPLLYMLLAPVGPGAPEKVGYLTPDTTTLQSWNANWVMADSDGEADVLVVRVTDTPATTMWTGQGAIAVFEEACEGCTVTVVETNTGQLHKLPGLVHDALVRHPDIDYVQVPFDVVVQPTVQGLQSAGRTDVRISSLDGTLAVMQMLGEDQVVASEVGTNLDALGWYGADQVLRMMSGKPSVQNLEFPYRRLFTAENVGELALTPEAEAAGSWYGGTDYHDGFKELWGVS
ncbi:sugar ABC transporter substrate-binding protein [Georgenia yuyongxinii]|uniref:Sugar ABC transporter substrate-binding protein n=1 Tax=Georgenia yuyongxinii TaxID=2589797 RepID=A0A5B8C075_9MICO|nr:substrate-binding domain-containing protein [Georgenia yuyongxinii]QDC23487.1 sugar ABC transporter substrate-binding protein [Georgenia yuyongxinii]